MLKEIGHIIYVSARDTVNHDGIEHAGYLAFLGLLALFPFLVLVMASTGSTGPQLAEFLTTLFNTLPPEVVTALEPRIQEITSSPPPGLLTLAIFGAVWTASSAVEGLRTILNRAYHVHTPPRYVFRRTLSILQLLIFAFVMIVGMLLLITLPALLNNIVLLLGVDELSAMTAYWGKMILMGSMGILLCVVAWIYYSVPNIKQQAISVWPGAIIVVTLWWATAKAFEYYLSHFDQVTLIYGSLAGIIAALLFFYLCNIVFIFGAEFNHHLSVWSGMKIVEREKVSAEDIAAQERKRLQ